MFKSIIRPSSYVLAAAAFAVAGGISSADASLLSVGTYNIHHGEGNDDVVDLDRIASVVASMDVQIVSLQENDIENSRTDFVHQPNVLADLVSGLTGANWAALPAPAISFGGGEYGNAVLYNTDDLTLGSYQVLSLPDPDGDGARSLGLGSFTYESTIFQFGATHLTHRNRQSDQDPNSTIHIDSMNIINDAIDPSVPAIVAGDFNAAVDPALGINPDSMAYWVSLGWIVDSPTDVPTFVGGNAAIDFVTSLGTDWRVYDTFVLVNDLTDVASDHYPVVTVFNVPVPPAIVLFGLFSLGLGLGARRRSH